MKVINVPSCKVCIYRVKEILFPDWCSRIFDGPSIKTSRPFPRWCPLEDYKVHPNPPEGSEVHDKKKRSK